MVEQFIKEVIMGYNDRDNHVDEKLAQLVSSEEKKSFVLFAGAGSGKTRSLVNLLEHIKDTNGDELVRHNKRVAVITFTNAATDEIIRRVGVHAAFHVATIHSFMWTIISPFQVDVICCMIRKIRAELDELEGIQENTRNKTTKTFQNRQKKIDRYRDKIEALNYTKRLNYNPVPGLDHDNTISHAEVISIGTQLLTDNMLFRRIVTQKYPVLLVDECQDTDKNFVDVLIELSQDRTNPIQIGFFGDENQQIYLSGKSNILQEVPENWELIYKQMNHRSSERIVQLNNQILNANEEQMQLHRDDTVPGLLRAIVVDTSSSLDKKQVEQNVHKYMATLSEHSDWMTDLNNLSPKSLPPRASLILEHKMAASRMGFDEMFNILHSDNSTKTDLANNSLTPLNFFGKTILPLIKELCEENHYNVMSLLRKKRSPLLLQIRNNEIEKPLIHLSAVNDAVNQLFKLWEHGEPKLKEIVSCIKVNRLFNVPNELDNMLIEETIDDDVWQKIKDISFSEVESYELYHSEQSPFVTHQGVKGLEYNHVMAIIDEGESKHNLFSYDKLFRVKELSDRDNENIAQGKDNVLSRTQRLFYVICSRAKKDLAIVYYTSDPESFMSAILGSGLVTEDELFSYDQIVRVLNNEAQV